MITKTVLLLSSAVICLSVLGVPEPEYFGGSFTNDQGWHFVCGVPDGVHPREIAPDSVQLVNIIPLLDTFEKNLRQGTLKPAVREILEIPRYLFSFVSDERFSSTIHEQYAKRLFEEYGNMDASVLLLYYQTGGSLESLQALYRRSTNHVIKAAVEACFFDAVEPLQEGEIPTITNDAPPLISVSIEYEPGAACRQLLFGVMDEKEGSRFGELCISYMNNSSEKLVHVEIPRGNVYYMNWCDFHVWRNDGIPVLPRLYGTHDRVQLMTLYPGDCYTRKVRLDFSVRKQGTLADALFSDFNKMGVVLADYWVGSEPQESFQVSIQLQSSYCVAQSEKALEDIHRDDWKTVSSNPLQLVYTPDKTGTIISSDQIKQDRWESIIEDLKQAEENVLKEF